MTEKAEGWYKHVPSATGELERDFARMKRMKATPKEFGLGVRTHWAAHFRTEQDERGMDVDFMSRETRAKISRELIEPVRSSKPEPRTASAPATITDETYSFAVVDRVFVGMPLQF